jgi:hypothetical protein
MWVHDSERVRKRILRKLGGRFLLPRNDFFLNYRGEMTVSVLGLLRCDIFLQQQQEEITAMKLFGILLMHTEEDEIVTSGITDCTELPESVWPFLLERAWKQQYVVTDIGHDAIYYLLKNSSALQLAIG